MAAVYINNAATAWPKAPGIEKAVADTIAEIPFHPGRTGFEVADPEGDCRKRLADLLQIDDSSRVILTANATHALNIALHGFPWREGAVAVVTGAEHNAVLRPLYFLRKHRNLRIEPVEVDCAGRVNMEKWEAALKKYHPQLVAFTHASNVTGGINPVADMCKLAKEVGAATLLDASQTMGFTEVLPQKWLVDMVAFTGHKYLLGPPGTGGLYISPLIDLEPVWVGGTGILSELEEMPSDLPVRFDVGTSNSPAFAGLEQALIWQRENPAPTDEIEARLRQLAASLTELGARVIDWQGPHTPVLSFTLPGWDVEDVGEILFKSFDIVCRTGLHCAPLVHGYLGTSQQGTIRFSLSRFTTDEEVEYVLSAMRGIIE